MKPSLSGNAKQQGFKAPKNTRTKCSRFCLISDPSQMVLVPGQTSQTQSLNSAWVCQAPSSRLQDGPKRREESGALSRNQQFSLQCSISPLKASRKLFNEKGLGRVSICSWLESLAKSEAHKPLLYFFFLVCK